MSEAPPPKPAGLRGAVLFGGAILLSLAILIPLLATEKAARSSLETTSETTAVGDENFLKHREKGAPPVLAYQGKPLVPASPRHLELHDTKMTYAGLEDGGVLRLYTTMEAVPWEKGEVEVKDQPVYFIKVEPNQYLRVQQPD